ncbi:MAG: GTPase HflX [Phycisphaeraceae bacterium]|nr:GTPase HflX [Phycisphaeraceae bacterium]
MPPSKERQSIKVQAERVVLAALRLPDSNYDRSAPFDELRALAEQAGAIVVGEIEQHRQRPEAGTYMGSGKVEELKSLCERLEAGTIIFDHDLSPAQISNIEEITERKVIDRSELILDIFAGRATTHEAKLQVEIAQLEYTYPRLRAMWSHLERIVGSGGIGGIGTRGPGEQQLEIDRRLVMNRKVQLQRELREIQARKKREVSKRNQENFTVGLVGYTNAGKSTLFNTLTTGGAYADDRVFATLLTRTREWDLGGGVKALLSDTVGFVRDLPHHLVASFRATLEEATHSDLLLIVLDVSDPAAELHYKVVESTLDALLRDAARNEEDSAASMPQRLVLLNKADRLADNRAILVWQQRVPWSIAISAIAPEHGGSGMGLAELTHRVREMVRGELAEYVVTVPMGESRLISMIESRSEVLGRSYDGGYAALTIRAGSKLVEEWAKRWKTSGLAVHSAAASAEARSDTESR